jgi:hypothetical protein
VTTGYPILEQIAQAIETRLAECTVDNDYQQTVSVKRPTRMGDNWTPDNNLVLLSQGDASRVPEVEQESYPEVFAWAQQFQIDIFTIPSESDPTPIEQLANVTAADVIATLTDPIETWHTWGNLAILSDITDIVQTLGDNAAWHVTTIVLTVTYRTPFNNPYTAA